LCSAFRSRTRSSSLGAFREAGYRAFHLDAKTRDDERRRIIAGLASGETQVLTNCGIIAEGVDVPALGCLVVLRPTQSLTLHLQMLGRVSRPAVGKANSIVLDHAGNVRRLGLPAEPHTWSLEGRAKKERETPSVKPCPFCWEMVPESARRCPYCHELIVATGGSEERMPDQRDGALVRVEDIDIPAFVGSRDRGSYARACRWAGDDPERLLIVCRRRGYSPGWVWHVLREAGKPERFAEVRDLIIGPEGGDHDGGGRRQ
jgi:hypothetical protein